MPSFRHLLRRFALLLAGCFGPLLGDTLRMPNGEKLEGSVVRETAASVVFRSASFGEITVARVPGLSLTRDSSAPAAPAAPAAATSLAAPPTAPGQPPPPGPSWIKEALGLSDRWSAQLEANLLTLRSEFRMSNRQFEATLGYKIPSPVNPKLARHEFGLFGSRGVQKVNDARVEDTTEVVARYFFQPASRWMLITQADWSRDPINSIDSSANLLALPAYKPIDRDRTRLLTGLGPSVRSETRLVPGPGGRLTERDQDSFRATLYQVFQHQFTPRLTLRESLLVMARPEQTGVYSIRFQASLRRMLTDHVSLSLSYDLVRDENEDLPLQSVATLKAMLGYQF